MVIGLLGKLLVREGLLASAVPAMTTPRQTDQVVTRIVMQFIPCLLIYSADEARCVEA
jgi:hypothetical protein